MSQGVRLEPVKPLGMGTMPGVSPDVYGENDFKAVAQIVRQEAGIMLPPGKATLVYSRLAPLVRTSGLVTFSAFIDMIRGNPEERRKVICALTTNHTFFFRESHHFDHFTRAVRPHLIEMLDAREAVRMWSAGSSSGEEVFSLTMALLGPDKGEGKRIATRDIRILASDIADHALHKAAQGRYELRDASGLPAPLRDNWTSSTDTHLDIGPDPRSLVQFKRLNLQGDWPMRRPFQVIFCRNVMIYFDQPTKERLVERLARQLVPGGFLYIGHSERVSGPGEALLETVGPTIYQRV
jgi:chemotaxis protein methyltransferase CheR